MSQYKCCEIFKNIFWRTSENFTTSYRRWNDVMCLLGKKFLGLFIIWIQRNDLVLQEIFEKMLLSNIHLTENNNWIKTH